MITRTSNLWLWKTSHGVSTTGTFSARLSWSTGMFPKSRFFLRKIWLTYTSSITWVTSFEYILFFPLNLRLKCFYLSRSWIKSFHIKYMYSQYIYQLPIQIQRLMTFLFKHFFNVNSIWINEPSIQFLLSFLFEFLGFCKTFYLLNLFQLIIICEMFN